MKEDNVKIIQFNINPQVHYSSNGTIYKDKVETYDIFGLGDDGNIYKYGKHSFWKDTKYQDRVITGWRIYVPL